MAGIRPPSPPFSPVVTWSKLFHDPGSSLLTTTSYSILNSSLQSGVDQTWSPFFRDTSPFIEKGCSSEKGMMNLLSNLKEHELGCIFCNTIEQFKVRGSSAMQLSNQSDTPEVLYNLFLRIKTGVPL